MSMEPKDISKAIVKKLNDIFITRLNMDFDSMKEELKQKHLFSTDLRLKPRDLIYIIFDIEREFNITIPQEDIANGRFSTFENLQCIIAEQLIKRNKADEECACCGN